MALHAAIGQNQMRVSVKRENAASAIGVPPVQIAQARQKPLAR